MEKIKTTLLIVLLVFVICCTVLGLIGGIKYARKTKKVKALEQSVYDYKKLAKGYEQRWKNRLQEIDQLRKENNQLTKEQLEKIPCDQKDAIILEWQTKYNVLLDKYEDVIKGDNKNVINNLKDCTKKLESATKLLNTGSNAIEFYVMPGISGLTNFMDTYKLNVDMIIGLDYVRYFLNDNIGLITGGWVKVELLSADEVRDIGLGLKLGGVVKLPKLLKRR